MVVEVGFWVQAVDAIPEVTWAGIGFEVVHKGGVGHVIARAENMLTIFWERSGITSDHHIDDGEFKVLCAPDAGRIAKAS